MSKFIPMRLTMKVIMGENIDLAGKNHAMVDGLSRSLSSHGLRHWHAVIHTSQLVKANKIDKLYC
ncbi:hypothetical protein [Bartonella koehlerae]|nr:hypothetical protein [Bartonella koehlerae]